MSNEQCGTRYQALVPVLLTAVFVLELVNLIRRPSPEQPTPSTRPSPSPPPTVTASDAIAEKKPNQKDQSTVSSIRPPAATRAPGAAATEDPTTALVAASTSAFERNDSESAIALLSAALSKRPNDPAALNLYRERLGEQFQVALKDMDWNQAQLQIAAYDSAIRAGLVACNSTRDVEELLRRKDALKPWNSALDDKILAEIKSVKDAIGSAKAESLPGLQQRLRDLPTARASEAILQELLGISESIAQRNWALKANDLTARLKELRTQAESPQLDLQKLREIQGKAEALNVEVIDSRSDDPKAGELLTQSRTFLGELDRRLQIQSLRETQSIADADAKQILDKATKIMATANDLANAAKHQAAGEKLAEAELVLGSIDRLASLSIQKQVRKLSADIRGRAIAVRSRQERDYNLWAIEQLEKSIADYKKAVGYFRDDKEAFKKILREQVGVIDPQHLHPATYALFSEMFQKLFSELTNEERAEITKVIEETQKRRLAGD